MPKEYSNIKDINNFIVTHKEINVEDFILNNSYSNITVAIKLKLEKGK